MYEASGDEKSALRYYLILTNTLLKPNQAEDEASEDEEEPELKPNTEYTAPPEVELDILKCSSIYQKLGKPKEAERVLLRGLEAFTHSFEIRKHLSNIYRARGDTAAAINITIIGGGTKRKRKREDSDSEYEPSEGKEIEEDNNEVSDEEAQDMTNQPRRSSRGWLLKNKPAKRFKVGEEAMNEVEINEKLQSIRKTIYEDYNHGDLILKFEQSKIHYENHASDEFISVFAPTFNSIIKRQLDIDTYANILKVEHNMRYSVLQTDTSNTNDVSNFPLSDQPFFIQNQTLYKNLETDRLKKERKINLDKINEELERLPNLYAELNEKVVEDSLFKLLSEISKQGKEHLVTDEMLENLWYIKMFNRYPESPKVLMIYLVLFKCLCINGNYRECYRVVKRLCRNYYNTPLFWGAFSHISAKLPRYYLVKPEGAEASSDSAEQYQYKVFSYRGHVQRIIQKYFESNEPNEAEKTCLPLLHILMGNNYLQSLNYENAIVSYKKSLEGNEKSNPLVYLLLAIANLQWCTCRTNPKKSQTFLLSFKYLKVSYQLIHAVDVRVMQEAVEGGVRRG